MKRALLIAGGTVGGLGAVLAITPPQMSGTSAINIAGAPMAATNASASSSTSLAAGVPTKGAKPVATKKTGAGKATAQATASGTTTAATTQATIAATTAATAAPATTGAKDGVFTGPAIFVNYGTVQVKITVANGKIVDAVAVQAPKGKNDRYTKMAVPILKQQTLAAQSANIQGASGASYTSYGWLKSLQGALADAGL